MFDVINKIFVSKNQKLVIQAYKACFCDDKGNLTLHGELVFKDLMDAGYLNKTTSMRAQDGHMDTHATYMAEGMRMLVLHMLDLIKIDLRKILDLEGQYND